MDQVIGRGSAAAKGAFEIFSMTSREERLTLLRRLLALYNEAYDEIAELMVLEMGTTLSFSKAAQAWVGAAHLEAAVGNAGWSM